MAVVLQVGQALRWVFGDRTVGRWLPVFRFFIG
jgi:hypothetical protein